MTNKQNQILDVYDNQERFWLENTARLMKRIGNYVKVIEDSMARGDKNATAEHLEMLKVMLEDEKESCENQLKTNKAE